jgi:Ca2+-binding RTX toxin-like protein
MDYGFKVGDVISIDPYSPSTWIVEGFSGVGNSEMDLNGAQLDPLPNESFKVTAVSQYIGIVKAVTKTSITLNLALSVADFPSGPLFPIAKGAAPLSTTANPLKVLNRLGNSAPFFVFPLANPYIYSGNDIIDAHLLDLTDETSFGPATSFNGTFTTTAASGQTAATLTQATGSFIVEGFAVGQTLSLSGAASGTFTITGVTALTLTLTPVGGSVLPSLTNGALTLTLHLLRPIGITAYGGPGDDTIIGSQTGDQLAGGSGNDTIMGQRGQDIIYGDSGFNVDLITRLLNVATVGTGPAGYDPAKFVDLDHLAAGNDLLYGEGPGSAPSTSINTLGNDDDIIFGDLGVVTQDVSGARDVTKPVPTKPQAISTTVFSDPTSILRDRFGAVPSNATPQLLGSEGVLNIDSAALQNGGNDFLYGGADRDVLVGGTGNDAVDGGTESDLAFGDNVSLKRTYHDTTSARFQTLCASLLYSRSDENGVCGVTVNGDSSGEMLNNGTAQAFRDPFDIPWWAEYDVTNMWQDFCADPSLDPASQCAPANKHWAGSFGNDYMAGNAGSDMVFGELGNDTIQGDGSIDFVAHQQHDNGDGTSSYDPRFPGSYDPNNVLGRVTAYRSAATCAAGATGPNGPTTICEGTGDETIYPSIGRVSDSEDYIEGNGGSDIVFGGLGQDDIVGGSSSFFSQGGQMIKFSGTGTALDGQTFQIDRIICQALLNPCGVSSIYDTLELNAPLPTSTVTGTITVVGSGISKTGTFILGNSSNGGTIQIVGFDWRAAGFDDGANLRPDVSDLLFGGSGELTARNQDSNGTLSPSGTPNSADNGGYSANDSLNGARDADTIVGDNGNIVRIVGVAGVDTTADNCTGGLRYGPTNCLNNASSAEALGTNDRYLSYVYDDFDTSGLLSAGLNHPDSKLVVHGVTLLDYTEGGPDYRPDLFNTNQGNCANGSPASGPCSNPLAPGSCHGTGPGTSKYTDIGGADEIHGESGNDTIYSGCGNDVIYGDAGNDTIVAGWGDDWVSSGTGFDGVLGDDGRLYTSRNSTEGYSWSNATDQWVGNCTGSATTWANATCLSEPLYGIRAFLPTDPDPKTSQGNVINEFVYTPGQVQTATINVAHYLVFAADETSFNLTPPPNADNPLYDANNSDDVIFGGWDGDFLHGGEGDDAMSGAEALKTSYIQAYADNCTPAQQLNNCVAGLVETDYYHPWNPGDILHFGADTNPWLTNHHIQSRLGEFLLYNEYDPRRAIEFNPDGTVWSCTAFGNGNQGCTASDPLVTTTGINDGGIPKYQFFLNNDPNDGRLVKACIAVDNQGNCTQYSTDPSSTTKVYSDGNDEIFGDLGNDWLVGGTGQNDYVPVEPTNGILGDPTPAAATYTVQGNTLWGGWGNDLLQADNDLSTGCLVMGNGNKCTTVGHTYTGDVPDGPNSAYQDRAYGGAGLDVLIGNTAGDRLIDWVGEFNSYIVPFAPFGIATVSRQVEPQLPEFLYALSFSEGADPTRAADDGTDPARNGEPFGEIGLVTQKDHGLWQQQTGSPSDPQAGNLPGGARDVLRSTDFNNGVSPLVADSGSWVVSNGSLQVAAASKGLDADAIIYLDQELPTYFELLATVTVQKPTAGWNANAFLIYDYFGPTDFKFAGIDVAANKAVLGHRDATGWHYDYQASVQGSLASNTAYQVQVIVNGLVVSVFVNGTQVISQQLAPRWINGVPNGFNMGFVGVGSNNSQGVFDNFYVQTVPPQSQFANTDTFDSTASYFTGDIQGTWTVSSGLYTGIATSSLPAVTILKPGVTVTPDADVQWETVIKAGTGLGGLVYDYYKLEDFKYVTLNTTNGVLTMGHRLKGKYFVDFTTTVAITPNTDQKLTLELLGTGVTVSVNGTQVTQFDYNGDTVDGATGLISQTGTTAFDNTRVQIGATVMNYVDNTPPTITAPASITKSTDPNLPTAYISPSTLGTATASDNVGINATNGITSSGIPAGNIFPIGVTTITWTATDWFGNTKSATQTVTVNDTQKPALTVPQNVTVTIPTGQSTATLTNAQLTATATDNSGSVTVTSSGIPAGNVFPLGVTTITYTATDAAGNTTTGTQTVTVIHPAIGLTAPSSQTSNEGSSTTFNLGTLTNGTVPYTVTVTWGDGTTTTLNPTAPGALSAAHTYAKGGTYSATVKATDSVGGSANVGFTVTVANLPPVVAVNTPTAGSSFQTGTSVSGKASFTDPGTADTHTCTIAWGDGATSTGTISESAGAGTCTASHAYSTAGNRTITFTVTDNAGASTTASVAISVTVPTIPPLTLTPGVAQTATEGISKTFSLGSFSGGTGPYTVTVTWGDGTTSTFTATAGAISAAHTYAKDQATAYPVNVTVKDSTGTTSTGSFGITVANAIPVVTISSPTAGSLFKAGASVSLSSSFTDTGMLDTHTCSIAWGDGKTSTGTVKESGGSGTCTGSHVYAVGNFTATVTVTDQGGAAGSKTVAFSVTQTGHGLFRPAYGVGGVLLSPLPAAPLHITTKPAEAPTVTHLAARHRAAKNTHNLSPIATAQLRRVLRFDLRFAT